MTVLCSTCLVLLGAMYRSAEARVERMESQVVGLQSEREEIIRRLITLEEGQKFSNKMLEELRADVKAIRAHGWRAVVEP